MIIRAEDKGKWALVVTISTIGNKLNGEVDPSLSASRQGQMDQPSSPGIHRVW